MCCNKQCVAHDNMHCATCTDVCSVGATCCQGNPGQGYHCDSNCI
jgi:hypothetical protein